ncbi:ABC transporter substrate-binding protein [Microvirga splendida]|uniref:ABC transporter substrate-binding protein n=1 Tax=Microvirga splendida TaxID=2795727 RepID=A0ABS0XVN9_9HYPH|nr:ABC transporter substrate-binding protein [Microvirga splendida]MBJ6123813.1 ABC transporter substrate-binding protein [Microvirga splendida]
MNNKWKTLLGAALLSTALPMAAVAQSGPLKILVLDDMSGIFAANGGPGTLMAVQMAVEDAGGKVLGRPIEVVHADHQNKPDVGSAQAQRFIEEQGVRAITLGGSSAVGLAAQARAAEAKVFTLASGAFAPNFSEAQCSPYGFQFAPSTQELSRAVTSRIVADGKKTWYLIAADYVFGHTLIADATKSIQAAGGKVLGQTLHPLNSNDMASALLTAQGSGADVIGLANAGTDLETTVKQAGQFGLGDKLAAMMVYTNNIEALTLDASKGMRMSVSTYWDLNDKTRALAKRMMAKNGGKTPTMGQMGAYGAVTHYLEAVKAAGTDDPDKVAAKMRELPISSGLWENPRIQANGRVTYDMLLVEVKTPAESKGPNDLYKIVAKIPAEGLFRTAKESGCPHVK